MKLKTISRLNVLTNEMETIEVQICEFCKEENVIYKNDKCVTCLRKNEWSYDVRQNTKAYWKRIYKQREENK